MWFPEPNEDGFGGQQLPVTCDLKSLPPSKNNIIPNTKKIIIIISYDSFKYFVSYSE